MGSGNSSPNKSYKSGSELSIVPSSFSSRSKKSVEKSTIEYSKSLTKPSSTSNRNSTKIQLTSESIDAEIEEFHAAISVSGIKLISFENFKNHNSFPSFDDFSDNEENYMVPLELVNTQRSFIVYISYNWTSGVCVNSSNFFCIVL